jgi:hypothetical protein
MTLVLRIQPDDALRTAEFDIRRQGPHRPDRAFPPQR